MRRSPRSTENPLPQGCRINPDGLNQTPRWGPPHGIPMRKWSPTDIATGWTETRSVKNKARKWVFQAIKGVTASFPFPILGIDSDNGGKFINWELFRWCAQNTLTFTGSRSGNKNDGAASARNIFQSHQSTPCNHRGVALTV